MPIVNTRQDLESLRGGPDYAAVLRALLGASSTWVNNGDQDSPVWQQRSVLSQIETLGFSTMDELLQECAAAGVVPTQADPPQPPADASSLAIARIVAAKAAVVAFADSAAAQITGPVPVAEQLGWVKKEAAARASIAGTAVAAQTAMLTAEATLTGETVAVLADKIVDRADLYSTAVALISGHRRATIALIDALGAAPTQAQLDAVLAAAKTQGEAALAALLA